MQNLVANQLGFHSAFNFNQRPFRCSGGPDTFFKLHVKICKNMASKKTAKQTGICSNCPWKRQTIWYPPSTSLARSFMECHQTHPSNPMEIHLQGHSVFEFSSEVVGEMFPITFANRMQISYPSQPMLKHTALPPYPLISIYVCHLVDIL